MKRHDKDIVMPHNDHGVRERAYALWELEGRPQGRDLEHWAQAQRELNGSRATPSRAVTSPSQSSSTPVASGDTGAGKTGEGVVSKPNRRRAMPPRSDRQKRTS